MGVKRTRDLRISTVVKAVPERVYRALTSPRELYQWWSARSEGRAVNGVAFRMDWDVGDVEPGVYPQALGRVRGVYVDLEPGRKVGWAWDAAGRSESVPRLVSFFIVPVRKDSEVTIQHCGFPGGPAAAPFYEGFSKGWEDMLTRLKRFLEARPRRSMIR